ncbi:MAG: non-ribosomal peptide synthetase [Clostridia bacterium]|nr:non-ribosomal peptide synthetase [Clostridia bacterium]
MKLLGLGQYKDLNSLILAKIDSFGENPTEFSTLFKLMFAEEENVIAETLSGYKIVETTYGECKKNAIGLAVSVENMLSGVPKNSFVGLNMNNGLRWIETFWAILLAGYSPLLINSRLPKSAIEEVIVKYGVGAVISDGVMFNSCKSVASSEIEVLSTDKTEDDFTFGREVVFMSSGTQGEVKLCAYTAERFYYQICDTYYIVKDCPQIKKGYEGKIKQLALLPFYHVFGFMAVYLWFGFFSRTFVFLKDLSPQTLLNTVRRHKVTHIFAVPLVWETIYKSAMNTIRSKDEKTISRVNKGLKLAKSKLGKALTRKAFGEIRAQIFGDSVQFMISGGSSVNPQAIEFLNAIGYHIANGYGMTEIGITSVELSQDDKKRNSLSIGKPFRHASYKVENGELFVKSQTRATRILYNGQQTVTDFNEWFKTGDLVTEKDESYFIDGRKDDLIVSETGENLNPNIIEGLFSVNGINEVCFFAGANGEPTLLLSCPKVFNGESVTQLKSTVDEIIRANHLENEIRKITFTSSPLRADNDFKISRKKLAQRYERDEFTVLTAESFGNEEVNELTKKIRLLFAKVLQKSEDEIGLNESFFASLGGNSLDYFTLIGLIREETGVAIPVDEPQNLSSVKTIESYITRRAL